jgi:hypothetical protein
MTHQQYWVTHAAACYFRGWPGCSAGTQASKVAARAARPQQASFCCFLIGNSVLGA